MNITTAPPVGLSAPAAAALLCEVPARRRRNAPVVTIRPPSLSGPPGGRAAARGELWAAAMAELRRLELQAARLRAWLAREDANP